jgi:hypothetical protein
MTSKSRLWLLRTRAFQETPTLVRLDSSCRAMESIVSRAVKAFVPVAARWTQL